MKTPRVTIVTVCKNAVDTIEKTIKSVVTQSYPNIEYIIIDGASTDGTQGIIKNYENQLAHFQSEPDKGIYDAMNKGNEIATGDWINFMNAGDYFYDENAVGKIISHVETQNFVSLRVKLLYCDVFVQRNNELNIRKHKLIFQYGLYNNICHQAVFYNLKKLGILQFDTQYKISADFDFLLKLATKEKGRFYQYIPEPLVVYQSGGLSENQALKALEERKTQFKSHIKNPVIKFWNQVNLCRQIRKKF